MRRGAARTRNLVITPTGAQLSMRTRADHAAHAWSQTLILTLTLTLTLTRRVCAHPMPPTLTLTPTLTPTLAP